MKEREVNASLFFCFWKIGEREKIDGDGEIESYGELDRENKNGEIAREVWPIGPS